MSCFCKSNPCVNLIKVYQNCKLICTKEGYFELICSPKICIKQRLISTSDLKVRNIIKLYNYEKICFKNICLINNIIPIPEKIVINQINGYWEYNDGKLLVNFREIKDLGVCTIDYTIGYPTRGIIKSELYIKDDKYENLKIKKCKMEIKT